MRDVIEISFAKGFSICFTNLTGANRHRRLHSWIITSFNYSHSVCRSSTIVIYPVCGRGPPPRKSNAMQTMSGFSQRAYNPHPDIPNTSPTYSQNSSRSKSQGYDALVAAQRNNADMGAVRKTSSGVGLSGIFKRNQSSEKKAFKGQAPARVQGRSSTVLIRSCSADSGQRMRSRHLSVVGPSLIASLL